MSKEFFVGLDVGTNSVGYAVTDTEYNLLKHRGEPMWGTMVFESAQTKAERRGFRTARRRLNRRQQRVILTQQIFAKEIAKVDARFFIRLQESGLYREDTSISSTYFVFEDANYTDKDYHKQYPTIHHLIHDLMASKERKDVRLVYLAVAWLMAHRGHFLSEVDKKNIQQVRDFTNVYERFSEYCIETYGGKLWECDENIFSKVMLQKLSVTRKEKAFWEALNGGKKFPQSAEDEVSKDAIIKLLAGGKIKPEKIFLNKEYAEVESVSLGMPEENFIAVTSELGDDAELLFKLREIYNWAILNDILAGETSISAAKVKVYEQHKQDLAVLKMLVKKYLPKDKVDLILKDDNLDNYAAYSGHNASKKCDKEAFCTFLQKQLKDLKVTEEDKEIYDDMMDRISLRRFLPKQVDGDNRVIPYQLYWDELNSILENAKEYLPFLDEADQEGYTNSSKLMSIFEFRIPYFVGPLRTDNSCNSWMQRKEGKDGKIYPWNFDEMVDLDASEHAFISRMTNKCSYLPQEDVLPKNSLLYSKFMVLNEINNLKVNGISIPIEVKWAIFEKFKEYKKVSVKKIEEVLISNGCMKKGDVISGLDVTIKSSLASYHAFKSLLNRKVLNEQQVEEIIKYMAYSEDKIRMSAWLNKTFPALTPEDKKYVLRLKLKDFGRLSERLLVGFTAAVKATGEAMTIMDVLWNTNDNLMQALSDKYAFAEYIEEEREAFYTEKGNDIDSMLDDMYVSNAVRRPIYRTLAILDDVKKATKSTPKRIFIEMARGEGEKGKRTNSRRDQIQELYANFDKQEVRELSNLLEGCSDNELQSEVLFLYFMQMGKCMYSGESINIEELKTSKYNVDHIYPQSRVKDDSLNNKVLVLSKLNGEKGDSYPITGDIQRKMKPIWAMLHERKMMSDEKYKRLTRVTSFSEEELQGFINRQLVETRQSTKALATILQRLYPETEVVYVKAGLASDFRREFDLLKSRQVNDLHHGKDAYLNVVCGNVYYCRFTKKFSIHREYSLKVKTIFTQHTHDGDTLVWNGQEDIKKVVAVMRKNNLHYTRFAFERKGGLFDQMPVKAGKGALPRKAGLPIAKYGGYNRSTASFFLLVKYVEKKKTDIMFMPVDLYAANKIMESKDVAMDYAKHNIANILGKKSEAIEVLDLPLGLRKLKINTIVEMDGFKVAIINKSNGGQILGLTSMESLKIGMPLEVSIKKLERFLEKRERGTVKKIDESYDEINLQGNMAIYDCFMEKLRGKKYSQLLGENLKILENARDAFEKRPLEEQAVLLMNILSLFKTGRSSTCDLTGVGGSKNAALLRMSSKVSNWRKNYTDVRICDISPSGIYETKSCNLLELL